MLNLMVLRNKSPSDPRRVHPRYQAIAKLMFVYVGCGVGMVIMVVHGCAEEGQIEPPGMHLGLGPWLLRFVRFVTFCSSEAVRALMNCGKWRPGNFAMPCTDSHSIPQPTDVHSVCAMLERLFHAHPLLV